MRHRFATALALYVLCTAGAARAADEACFLLSGPPARAAGSSTARRVTLGTEIRTRVGCEYALSAEGPWRPLGAAASGGRDFATLLGDLGGAATDSITTAVYARSAAGALESIFLAGCTEYLLSRGKGFEMRVPVDGSGTTVRRTGEADDCGAASLSLRFVSAASDPAARVPAVRAGPWAASLDAGERALMLEPGAWVVYASRGASEVGLRVGRFDTKSPLSPLRAALRDLAQRDDAEPWLRASWASGRLALEPVSAALAATDAWAELRTAAAAGALWLSREDASMDEDEAATLAFDAGGSAIVFPSAPVEAVLGARYDRAASFVVPTFDDWQEVWRTTSLCLAGRYPATPGLEPAQRGGEGSDMPPAPPSLARLPVRDCVPLARIVAPLAVRGGRGAVSGQICLRRSDRVMTASGAAVGYEVGERCVVLPAGAAGEAPPSFVLATVGDSLTFAGVGGAQLFACIENDCQPVPSRGQWLALEHAGLVEIRQVEQAADARARGGLTLLRLGVLDPATEWHPVGLYEHEGTPPPNRWTTLDHDEDDVFTFVRGRHALRFASTTSPALAAAWNARSPLGSRMTRDLPLVVATEGSADAPPASALVVLATHDPVCSALPARAARKELVDPESLLVDDRFYVHLAHDRGDDEPYDCLATAGFRVTENLSLRALPTARVGLVGDVQGMVFLNRPAAAGLALPVAYGRMRFGLGLGLDLSVSLTGAVVLDRTELSRAGLGASAMVTWGPERVAPRLLSVGAMLHAATGTVSAQEPVASFVAALNLSTLVDMAGGR